MRARSLVAAATVFFAVGVAHADPKGDIEKKIKTAMESYDMMDYDAAKKQLNQALAAAKKAKLDKDAVAAKAYLDLGIVAFVNNDPDSAKLSFLSAVQIQPKIQIDAAYKSADMAKLLEEARSEAKGGGGEKIEKGGGGDKVAEPAPSGEPTVDCTGLKGLDHTIIETAKAGAPLAIEAKLGNDVKASRVSVMFRPEHATDFIEVKMTKQGDCKYTAQIPASGTKGSLVHYYVAAYGEGPKPIASKGSSGSPNIIELTGGGKGGAAKGDDEDPINGKKKDAKPKETASSEQPEGGEVTATAPTSPKHPHVLLAVTGGSGFGYLQGTTEALNPVKSAGVGMAGFVLMPELGYIINPKLSIGLVARLQFPVGANVDGHATLGPGGLIRLRYNLQPGDGIHVMGQLGAGIIRNTLKLDNAMPGQDTDVVAQGPLLIGGGAGYTKQLSSSVMFLADFSLLAGLAIGCTTDPMTMNCGLGSSPALNNGVTIDLSVGLALGL